MEGTYTHRELDAGVDQDFDLRRASPVPWVQAMEALAGSAIWNERTMEDRGCSARERNFRMLRTGAQCCSKIAGCSARERNFLHNFENAPHESAIFCKTRTKKTSLSGAVV